MQQTCEEKVRPTAQSKEFHTCPTNSLPSLKASETEQKRSQDVGPAEEKSKRLGVWNETERKERRRWNF
jgi:hypothetical protein